MSDSYRDGNSAAGALSEVFSVDMTTALAVCDPCGSEAVLARARVLDRDVGTVLRCPTCDAVLLRITETGTAVRLETPGLRTLSFDTEPSR